MTCIPEEVAHEVHTLQQTVGDFLASPGADEMTELMIKMTVERAVVNGLIPLPCTLTEAARFLGTFETSSLLRKGTDER